MHSTSCSGPVPSLDPMLSHRQGSNPYFSEVMINVKVSKMSKDFMFVFYISVGVLTSFLLGCSPDRKSVVEAAPAIEDIKAISCLGRIVAGDGAVKIAAPPQAIVSELLVHRGSRVARGDVLAVLEDYAAAKATFDETEQQVAVAESTLTQVKAPEKRESLAAQQAVVARQEFTLRNAETDYQRKKKLFDAKLIALMDEEGAEAGFHAAQEALRREQYVLAGLEQVRDVDVDLARKKLAAAIAARDVASVQVERNRIKAPMAGMVLEVFARAGEAVSTDRGILDLGDTANMFVEAEVYVTDFPRVREGAKATITGDSFTGTLTGAVTEILRQAGVSTLFPTDPLASPDNRIIRVRIRLGSDQGVERLSGAQVAVRIES
jgi:HlyD family secretion protein